MSLWNLSSASGSLVVARGRNGHFAWLAFDTDQRLFDFKIVFFFFEFAPSSSKLLIIFRVTHVLYGDSPLIQNKSYWFWNQISLWNVSSASRSLVVARGTHGHFEWLAFDTDQRFFYFKIIFSLNLRQVLQGCLLFLGLQMSFTMTRLWYRTKDIDFEIKFPFGMCQVHQCPSVVARSRHGHFSC